MAQDGRSEDKPEGFSKYLKRMKTVLRPRSMSKRQSITPGVAAPTETTYDIQHSSTSALYTNYHCLDIVHQRQHHHL